MKRRITLLITALMLALSMSFGGAAAAFADTQACQEAKKNPNWDCRGSHLENPGGKDKGKFPGK
jgi:Spy/CpxP family protein refolding chaperone